MTIEQARKNAVAVYRKANRKERGDGPFWEVITEVDGRDTQRSPAFSIYSAP